jgi:signal transduction histidine kinase/HAMP domain-containing protein
MPEDDASPSTRKVSSISRRFTYALTGIVTLVLIVFAAAVIYFDIHRIRSEMDKRLENAILLSKNSLSIALWNMDYMVVNDFVEALFLDESIVYIKIFWEDLVITERSRPGFSLEKINAKAAALQAGSNLKAESVDIYYKDKIVGTIHIAMTLEKVKKQVLFQVYGTTALVILLIAAIWLTSIFITRRYISTPLLKLQASASMIARGDLDTFVDKSGRDEIGMLARHLDKMRRSIQKLFAELRRSKDKLEDYSRTLEQKVAVRTQELARSVAELTALGQVSRAVSSTLDLETVLTSIVRHALQLSKADAGTIYEFDESQGIFLPRINYGTETEFVKALRDSQLRVGDGTVIGQAAAKRAPVQIADLVAVPDYPLPYVGQAGYRALLALPLLREERLIGGLVVRRRSAGEFPAPVVNLLQTFASQSVLAIHNARLFREIEEKGHELEIVNRHKSEFLANMSHELRTPLNAILGYTELILDHIYGEVPEKIEEVLQRLEKNGRHLLNLINDVLDLSKIEAGRLILSLNDYSMVDVIQTVSTSLEPLAVEKKLDLKVILGADLPIGRGDEQRISQVVLNLIGNAIKFTNEGEIRVEASVADDSFLVSVTDTGPGIAETDQKKIFEEFRQVDGSSTRKKGGTGLGLSISQKIIAMHGGSIWVESAPGKGSTFVFTLPVRVEKQRKHA